MVAASPSRPIRAQVVVGCIILILDIPPARLDLLIPPFSRILKFALNRGNPLVAAIYRIVKPLGSRGQVSLLASANRALPLNVVISVSEGVDFAVAKWPLWLDLVGIDAA